MKTEIIEALNNQRKKIHTTNNGFSKELEELKEKIERNDRIHKSMMMNQTKIYRKLMIDMKKEHNKRIEKLESQIKKK